MRGWTGSSGNAMTILFGHVTGAGVRWVESFEPLNGVDTPALFIEVGGGGGCGDGSSGVASVGSGVLDGAEETVASGAMCVYRGP